MYNAGPGVQNCEGAEGLPTTSCAKVKSIAPLARIVRERVSKTSWVSAFTLALWGEPHYKSRFWIFLKFIFKNNPTVYLFLQSKGRKRWTSTLWFCLLTRITHITFVTQAFGKGLFSALSADMSRESKLFQPIQSLPFRCQTPTVFRFAPQPLRYFQSSQSCIHPYQCKDAIIIL